MSSNRDIASLLDIAKAAQQVLKFKGNLDKTAFLQDDKTQSAILYQLLIIGEAVSKRGSDRPLGGTSLSLAVGILPP